VWDPDLDPDSRSLQPADCLRANAWGRVCASSVRAMSVVVRNDEGSSFDAPGEAKRAANQAVFREANERIREIVDQPDVVLPVVPFVCECGDPSCRRLLNVPLAVYANVRRSPRRFLHAPDHINDGTSGSVVETLDGFAVVEKSGVSGEVAEREVPRGD
jgi:hypothetical protein